jgi:hypothetical protein
MLRVLLGLVMGLASAFAINWSFFVQHGAVNAAALLSLRRPLHSLRTLYSNPRWLVGYGAGWVGWIVYIAALRFAPLSLVQASASGGIAFLALLCYRSSAVRVTHRQQQAIAVAVFGLALLGASLGSGVPVSRVASAVPVVVAVGLLMGLALCVAWPLLRVLGPGAALGMAAGCAYAASDISAKAAVTGRPFFVPLLLLCSIGGFVALQLAFQRGSALATVGLSTLAGGAFPILAGPLVFGEQIPAGVFGVLRIAGFVAVVVGATALARSQQLETLQLEASVRSTAIAAVLPREESR